ncbi:MAG TPA: hypothetical protein VKV24_13650 [Casimicrobiaceae bacterium]|nr:hypothetical protein [Casimicrobiaceae bacterium]
MKTTLELPDALFRKAKSRAAERGQTLKAFVTEAIEAKLVDKAGETPSRAPPWMSGFGKLRRLRKETARIQAIVDAEFESVESEDRL